MHVVCVPGSLGPSVTLSLCLSVPLSLCPSVPLSTHLAQGVDAVVSGPGGKGFQTGAGRVEVGEDLKGL